MKYDLEDLLQKTYAQKEQPTKEFCQSVICEMKAKEHANGFFISGRTKYKIMMVAACIVLILLVGVTANEGQKKPSVSRATFEQAVVGTETRAPTETDFPAQTDFAKHTNEMSSEKNAQYPEGSSADGKMTSDMGKMQAAFPTAKPASCTRQIGTTMSPDTTAQPRTTLPPDTATHPGVTMLPAKTAYPVVTMPPAKTAHPGVTMPPVKTPLPAETPSSEIIKPADNNNYVSLCSIETSAFSYDIVNPDNENIAIPAEFWGNIFYDRMIVSYEELQSLLQKAKKEADRQPDNAEFQKAIGQLERYDRDYFATNVLCIKLFHLDKGSELKLAKVCIEEKLGKSELNICVQIIPGMSGEKEKKYYTCLVQVPREIAGKCNSVNMIQS